MRSRLTLIVDGNWLLMSRLMVLVERYSNSEELSRELKLLMIRSINLVIRTFPSIDNIIIVADGGSWRNTDLPIPTFLESEHIEYKGNREKDKAIDWDSIFSAYNEFLDVVKSTGITVCKEKGIEGDDWCWWWSKQLNSMGTNVIIWSKDRDLTQLVNTDNDSCFTVCWNKESGVTILDKPDDEFDFLFNNAFSDNDTILHYIEMTAKDITKIKPNSVRIDKIIRGDLGDNVLPILIKKSKSETSTRKYKVATKDIDNALDIFDDNAVRMYINNLCSSKSYKNRANDKSVEDVYEHFCYNRNLVVLDEKIYPSKILDIFSKYKEININKDLSRAEEIFASQHANIQDILDII